MSTSSDGNANQGDSDGSWEYAPDYPRSPLPPLPLPTSSASEGDSDDPAVEINDMKNKLEHDSSLVHYWTQKCVGAEQKLAYLKRQVNKARYRKEKHRIRGQRRKHKAEDLHMTEEDATYESFSFHKGGDKHGQAMSVAFNEGFEQFRRFAADVHKIDWDAITPSAAQQIISGGVHPPELGHQQHKPTIMTAGSHINR
ncbi:uncharacterized protein Pyn_08579 [Prunus yedoensis var. nudiflora]|uniref:Uncharacterized protein n=1 Tax=Prunus yedoensis var. nudiflora TaxID=2094558 RepID=A0A314ZJM6_PRUYE|nr:uncharacterized protein Pyn_08579 [Prunus yedoensis var. nudiflora]